MIKTYAILVLATLFEVAGTMLLPVTKGFSKPLPTTALSYILFLCIFLFVNCCN